MAAVPSIGRASKVEHDTVPGADAASALYERYSHQVFGYCLHHLGSREEAEDAVQTTFMNAFRGLGRGIVPECEQAWLFKIAHNVCLSRRRSSWRRGRVEAPNNLEVLQEIIPAREKVADELIPLQDVLQEMPVNQRRAILLREWQGLSYREVAEELDVSQAAVETLIFRARRSLAAGLQEARPSGSLRKRLRRGADLGGVLAFVKTLFGGGGAAAVKVAAAVALAGAAIATTGAEHLRPQDHARRPAVPPAVVATAPATASVLAGLSASAARVRATVARRQHRPARRPGAVVAAPQSSRPAPLAPEVPTQAPASGPATAVASGAASPSDVATPTSAPQTPPGQSTDTPPSKPAPASQSSATNNGKAKGKANGASAATATPTPPPAVPTPTAAAHTGRGNSGQTGSAPSPDTTVPGNSGAEPKGKADADATASPNGNGPPETPPGQGGEPRANAGHDK